MLGYVFLAIDAMACDITDTLPKLTALGLLGFARSSAANLRSLAASFWMLNVDRRSVTLEC